MVRRRQAGFTFMELLIVIIVMGIVATVGIPRLMDRTSDNMLGTRDNLRNMLRLARQLAMAQQSDVCVTISAAAISLVKGTAGGCNGAAVLDPATSQPNTFAVPTGVTFAGPVFVRFDKSGRPMNVTGTAALAGAPVALTVGTTGLTVYPQTGFVN